MKFKKNSIVVAFASIVSAHSAYAGEINRPNVLLIVGDDVGFSDTEPFGSEVKTPNLMSLAREGVKFTNFHASPTSSVTRSMMLTGANSIEVGLGTFDYAVYPPSIGKPGYEGYLTKRGLTIATLLRDNGYHTYMAGKWHLGSKDGHLPSDRGFTESYGVLGGGSGFFTHEAMFPEKTEENAKLLKEGKMPGVSLEPFYRNGKKVKDEFKGQYIDQVYTNEIIGMIDKNKSDGKPFFAYVPFQAIHLPLQAPDYTFKDKIDFYVKKGWDALRKDRFESMKAMGIIPQNVKFTERNIMSRKWDALSSDDKAWYGKKMAIAMGMMELQDKHVGEIIKYLKSIGKYDDTLIIYMSDNGPEATDVTGKNISSVVRMWNKHHFDNSFDNIGKVGSNISLGPEWANASTGGLSWFKGYTSEGGLRVPLIIKPPKGYEGRAGLTTNSMAQVKDIAATVLDVANIEHPGTSYKGRDIAPMSGVSVMKYLAGLSDEVHGPDNMIPFEMFGSGIVLMGDYKIIRTSSGMGGDNKWHLYNTKLDPTESFDIQKNHPEIFNKMLDSYRDYEKSNGIVPVDDNWNAFENVK